MATTKPTITTSANIDEATDDVAQARGDIFAVHGVVGSLLAAIGTLSLLDLHPTPGLEVVAKGADIPDQLRLKIQGAAGLLLEAAGVRLDLNGLPGPQSAALATGDQLLVRDVSASGHQLATWSVQAVLDSLLGTGLERNAAKAQVKFASQAVAEAGTNQTDVMNALRVGQAIAAQSSAGKIGGPPVIKVLAADMADIGTSFVDVTGLSIPIGASETWVFEWHVTIVGATGVEFRLAFNGPASPTLLALNAVSGGADASGAGDQSAYDSDIIQRNGPGTESYLLRAYVVNGANAGNFVARARSANLGSGDVRRGAFLKGWRVA